MNNNRDWIKNTLSHQETERVPYNFMFSPPAQKKLEHYYNTDSIGDTLNLPIRMSGPITGKPLYASPEEFGESVEDEFGVVWSTSEIDRGSPVGPPLKEPDLKDYTFPDPSASWRFEGLPRWCHNNKQHYRILWVGDLWERATFMRGMENLLVDIALRPRFVRALLRGLTDYILYTMAVLFDKVEFDCIALSDDYGIQKSILISPDDWRKFIRPLLVEIYSLAKSRNRAVFHHSCGNIYPIIGDMIDIGLDILHPIQPEAMDIYQLKREFGRHLTFCGGLNTQQLLPRGTPRRIRDEVKKLKQVMGQGAGFILEPGITVQADVPLENLVAMIEEARAD